MGSGSMVRSAQSGGESALLIHVANATPRPKQSARFVRGRVVSMAAVNRHLALWTRQVEAAVRETIAVCGVPDWCGEAVALDMEFRFACKDESRWGSVHTSKPDADNLCKPVQDIMEREGLLFRGDSRVSPRPVKVWAKTPGMAARLAPMENVGTAEFTVPDWLV